MTDLTRRQAQIALFATPLAATLGTWPPGAAAQTARSLTLDPLRYRSLTLTIGERRLAVRAFEQLPTVAWPVAPEHQALNLYVPEAYFRGESIGRYTARTAPIFLPNQVGGYLPALPGTPEGRGGPPPGPPGADAPGPGPGAPAGLSTIAQALAHGLVVAAPGARGRTQQGPDGRWLGKAPAAIVDLKAAVRWLRHNAGRYPGNPERIVSNGTSAGGALSALLGASGNHPDHAAALQALGAADERDDLFAVSAYCPITHLEHADAAYEWQFCGINDYRRIEIGMLDFQVQRREVPGTLTAEQQAWSEALAASFPAHVNALGLRDTDGRPLRLDEHGRGSLRDQVQALLLASAQAELDAGRPLGDAPWLRVVEGRVQGMDWAGYVRAIGRMKVTPAFDGVALDTGENQLFGDEGIDKRHFTEFSLAHSRVPGARRADALAVRQMNAMAYLGDPAARVAPNWRIRHGSIDRDTSLAIPTLLAAAARQRARRVDLALAWNQPHGGDYELDTLWRWIDECVAQA